MTDERLSAGPDSGPDAGSTALEWSFNPWRERPGVAAVATSLACGLCLLPILQRAPVVLSLGLAAAVFATLGPALSPAQCRIDETGIARRGWLGWTRREWSQVRRARVAPGGLVLFSFATPNWLDPYRSVRLPLPSTLPADGLAAIQSRLKQHGL